MNENAKAWIAALRSGEYTQAKETLYEPEHGFCCLGVACDLFAKENSDSIVRDEEAGGFLVLQDENDWYSETEWLPSVVQKWYGLKTNRGIFRPTAEELLRLAKDKRVMFKISGDDVLLALDNLNDYGFTFSEIADFIEAHADELFDEE